MNNFEEDDGDCTIGIWPPKIQKSSFTKKVKLDPDDKEGLHILRLINLHPGATSLHPASIPLMDLETKLAFIQDFNDAFGIQRNSREQFGHGETTHSR